MEANDALPPCPRRGCENQRLGPKDGHYVMSTPPTSNLQPHRVTEPSGPYVGGCI